MTMQELYSNVTTDSEFKASLIEAMQSMSSFEAWLKEKGCNNTPEQFIRFISRQQNSSSRLTDD